MPAKVKLETHQLELRKRGDKKNDPLNLWDIDEKKSQDIGEIAASFSAVSHCYLRPQYPNWKYNLFTINSFN